MATKAEERKALEKIKNIVESIGGKDSYIGMAFEGVFEMAEDNIENDFGRSAKIKWETIANERDFMEREATNTSNKLREVQRDYDEYKRLAEEATEEYQRKIANLEEQRDYELAKRKETEAQAIEIVDAKVKAETALKEAQREIIELKAKLYDLMVKEG